MLYDVQENNCEHICIILDNTFFGICSKHMYIFVHVTVLFQKVFGPFDNFHKFHKDAATLVAIAHHFQN